MGGATPDEAAEEAVDDAVGGVVNEVVDEVVDGAAEETDVADAADDDADASADGAHVDAAATTAADTPRTVGPAAYDFENPGHRLAGDWPVLELVHRNCSSALLGRLGERFRFGARGEARPSRRLRPAELAASIADDALVRELALAPLPGVALITLDAMLLPALVDAWFGGDGRPPERVGSTTRALSATERRALAHLLEAFTASLAEAWRELAALEPAVGRETTAQRLAHGGWSDVAIDCGLDIVLGGEAHALRLIYPAVMLEPFAERLSREDRSAPVRDTRFDEGLRRGLLDCELEVSGVLAETRVTLRELMRLKPGDFIPLRDVETVSFRTERIPLFDARVGHTNGRVSASLSRWHLPERS